MPKKKTVETPEDAETAAAVEAAAKDVAEAKAKLDEANVAHEEAKARHAEATKPPLPIKGKQFLIEGSDAPCDLLDPKNEPCPYRMLYNGVNLEHVSDAPGVDENGDPAIVWVYRRM